ncbi:unnamed protein product [Prunus armeniaca]
MHLGSTISNRAESAHAKLKRQLRSSQLNFERSWVTIHSLLELEHTEIKASFEKSRCFIQHRFRHPELRELVGFVSIKALSVIVCELERLETDGVDALSCGCAIRRTHQLPCAHEIAEYREHGVPIPLDVVHSHWRKLDIINIGNSSHGTTSPGRSQLQRFNMWYEQQDGEKKRQAHMTLEELMNPGSTALIEPKEKLKTKGRPRKVDTSTRCLPSAFEIAKASIALPKNKPKQSLTTSLKIKPKQSTIAVPKKETWLLLVPCCLIQKNLSFISLANTNQRSIHICI